MGREIFVPTRTLIGVKLLMMHFSTQWSPNSQFWRYSVMWQCYPCVTVKPKLCAWRKNVNYLMPRGLILDDKGINKIGEEETRGGKRLHPSGWVFGSYVKLSSLFSSAIFFTNAAPTCGGMVASMWWSLRGGGKVKWGGNSSYHLVRVWGPEIMMLWKLYC
jgi:hypothetical protein